MFYGTPELRADGLGCLRARLLVGVALRGPSPSHLPSGASWMEGQPAASSAASPGTIPSLFPDPESRRSALASAAVTSSLCLLWRRGAGVSAFSHPKSAALARELALARARRLVDGVAAAFAGKSACGQPSQVLQATGDVQEEDWGDLGNWKSFIPSLLLFHSQLQGGWWDSW